MSTSLGSTSMAIAISAREDSARPDAAMAAWMRFSAGRLTRPPHDVASVMASRELPSPAVEGTYMSAGTMPTVAGEINRFRGAEEKTGR